MKTHYLAKFAESCPNDSAGTSYNAPVCVNCNNCNEPTYCPKLKLTYVDFINHRCPECYNVFIDRKMRKQLMMAFAGLKKNKMPTLVIVKILSGLALYWDELR